MSATNDTTRRAALEAQLQKQEAARKAEKPARPYLARSPHDLRAQAVARALELIRHASTHRESLAAVHKHLKGSK